MSKLEATKKAHNALEAKRDKCLVKCEELSVDLNRMKAEKDKFIDNLGYVLFNRLFNKKDKSKEFRISQKGKRIGQFKENGFRAK